ncbi:Rne/Rng family ribonuclease [Pedococcus sp. 5OH_020]|uniref:Rne/Rng family ribonuclease n=1 Tax=Pedococcus sp. 5OH_020 TaxID=2989814 RepID=UPI0022E9F8BD|nr:Rne/Rng family ribonuclease [Pedococcus sp. 5OH_020]
MASTEDLFTTPGAASADAPAPADKATTHQTTPADEGSAAQLAPADQGSAAQRADDSAPAPARKRARRATKKASAPAATPDVAPAGTETGAASDPAPSVADIEAPVAKKAAKKTAAKKTAAKKAPAKKATAKKATAKKATGTNAAATKRAGEGVEGPGEVSDVSGALSEQVHEADSDAALVTDLLRDDEKGVTDTGRGAPQAQSLADADDEEATADDDADDDTTGDDDTTDDEPAQGDIPAVPSFGVLFQAPDPAAATPVRSRARKTETVPDEAGEEPIATEESGQPSRRPRRGGRGRASAAEGPVEPVSDADIPESAGSPASTEASEPAEPDDDGDAAEGGRRRRRRGGKGRGRGRGAGDAEGDTTAQDSEPTAEGDAQGVAAEADDDQDSEGESPSSRRRRRRRRSGASGESEDPPGTVTRVREARRERDEPQSVKGSTRLEAKKQRRREGREAGRRRTIITEAEFLARRESVERVMVVREREGRTQIGVLEDDVLVEHYVSRETNASMAGNVYLGRVQNVLPSMEAAFVDIGKGRNAVLYAGEVNWDAAGLENNQPKRIENALKSGDPVLVQVTKDPIGHKGARLTSQISLPGRYLVYVPEGSMTGISRKLPDTERARLKSILKEVVPDSAGVIVRTAAEGASEEELRADVERLTATWEKIKAKAESKAKAKGGAPVLVHGEPDLTVRVIRDVFNEDFTSLVVAGEHAYAEVSEYLGDVAPDLAGRLQRWTAPEDLFTRYRVDEQIAKAMDRKVWLPSGGSLVIDRTEAMTVVDVNTGKFVGSGGNLEETVTKNNIEAAEEIVRQLRLRDIGGIIVIDFIDMVLESNRDLVVRRLLECLGRDRTKHQVAEVTSLGLVQMTRKRVGSGLIEVFSETCEHCGGRGIIVHADPVDKPSGGDSRDQRENAGSGGNGAGQAQRGNRGRRGRSATEPAASVSEPAPPVHSGPTPAQIAAAAHAAALKSAADHHGEPTHEPAEELINEPTAELTDEHAGPHVDRHDGPQVDRQARDAENQSADTSGDGGEPAVTGSQAPAVVPTGSQAPAPLAAQPPAVAPVLQPVGLAATAVAPRRRKRARVVAPAGPPRGSAGDHSSVAAAEPSGEQA